MIWRDDDVLRGDTDLADLLAVDDLLQQAGVRHTVAIIAETLTPEVAAVLRARGMSCQLHCWHHDDLSVDERAVAQLPQAVDKIADLIGVRPTVLYPPWNRTSPMLQAAAAALGLRVSWQKVSLEPFTRVKGHVTQDTINFHYWHAPDRLALVEALRYAHVRPRGAA
jgi:peptidoglycan/xylan/chitin deacetylase (PgdA/CDA1 family)